MGISEKISHYRYRLSLSVEFHLMSITNTDFGLEANKFCNHCGYNGQAILGNKATVPTGSEVWRFEFWVVSHFGPLRFTEDLPES